MAQRSSWGLAGSRIGRTLGRCGPAFPYLQSDWPHHLAASIRFGPHELAADVVTLAGLGALETEEGPAVPAGAGDGLGDGGERGVALAPPRKAIVQHHHLVGLLLPCPDQLGAGLDARL